MQSSQTSSSQKQRLNRSSANKTQASKANVSKPHRTHLSDNDYMTVLTGQRVHQAHKCDKATKPVNNNNINVKRRLDVDTLSIRLLVRLIAVAVVAEATLRLHCLRLCREDVEILV